MNIRISEMTASEISEAMLDYQPTGWKNCEKCGSAFWSADDEQADCQRCLRHDRAI